MFKVLKHNIIFLSALFKELLKKESNKLLKLGKVPSPGSINIPVALYIEVFSALLAKVFSKLGWHGLPNVVLGTQLLSALGVFAFLEPEMVQGALMALGSILLLAGALFQDELHAWGQQFPILLAFANNWLVCSVLLLLVGQSGIILHIRRNIVSTALFIMAISLAIIYVYTALLAEPVHGNLPGVWPSVSPGSNGGASSSYLPWVRVSFTFILELLGFLFSVPDYLYKQMFLPFLYGLSAALHHTYYACNSFLIAFPWEALNEFLRLCMSNVISAVLLIGVTTMGIRFITAKVVAGCKKIASAIVKGAKVVVTCVHGTMITPVISYVLNPLYQGGLFIYNLGGVIVRLPLLVQLGSSVLLCGKYVIAGYLFLAGEDELCARVLDYGVAHPEPPLLPDPEIDVPATPLLTENPQMPALEQVPQEQAVQPEADVPTVSDQGQVDQQPLDLAPLGGLQEEALQEEALQERPRREFRRRPLGPSFTFPMSRNVGAAYQLQTSQNPIAARGLIDELNRQENQDWKDNDGLLETLVKINDVLVGSAGNQRGAMPEGVHTVRDIVDWYNYQNNQFTPLSKDGLPTVQAPQYMEPNAVLPLIERTASLPLIERTGEIAGPSSLEGSVPDITNSEKYVGGYLKVLNILKKV